MWAGFSYKIIEAIMNEVKKEQIDYCFSAEYTKKIITFDVE